MKIIFLRHFQPKVDKTKPVVEWKLDEEGKKAMKDLLDKDIFKNIKKIFTSPELKARITARAVNKKYKAPIVVCKEIGEVDRSKAGFIEEDYIKIVESYLSETEDFEYEWENIDSVKKRIQQFVKKLENEKDNVLVISHGMFLSILLSRCFNKDRIEFWKNLRFGQVINLDYKILKRYWG